MDRRCIRFHIHWSHLQRRWSCVFLFFFFVDLERHLNNRRWTQKIVFGSCTFSVHFCLQLIVPVLTLDWSKALISGKSKSYSDISSILSSILVGVLRIILTAYSAITLKARVVLLRYITISSFTSLLINTLDNGHWYLIHQVINLAFQLLQYIRWNEEVGFIKVLEINLC